MRFVYPSFAFGTDDARGLCVLALPLGLMTRVAELDLDPDPDPPRFTFFLRIRGFGSRSAFILRIRIRRIQIQICIQIRNWIQIRLKNGPFSLKMDRFCAGSASGSTFFCGSGSIFFKQNIVILINF